MISIAHNTKIRAFRKCYRVDKQGRTVYFISMKFRIALILLVLQFMQFMGSEKIGHAQNEPTAPLVTTWPLLFASGNPRLNRTGSMLAVSQSFGPPNARTVSIYRIQSDGQIGDPVWTLYKSNPDSICHAFAWQGEQLLFSKSDTKNGKRVEDLSEQEFEALRNAPGKTFRFDPVTKVAKEILPTAYEVLAVNKDNNRLAAGTPVGTGKKGASLAFFDLGTNKLLGQWSEPKWEKLRDMMPYFFDWGSEGDGVFVVGPRVPQPGTTDTFQQPNLFYVSLKGEAKQVGHKYASMISGYQGMPPLGVAGVNNTATVVTVNGNGFMGISRSNRERAERSYTWASIQKIVLPGATRPWDLSPVAITPNSRMVLVQAPKPSALEGEVTEADFWLIDFQDKRQRKLGTFPFVFQVYSWEGDKLIVAFKKPDGDTNFGFFRLPEAVLPADSPQLQQILQMAPWKGTPG